MRDCLYVWTLHGRVDIPTFHLQPCPDGTFACDKVIDVSVWSWFCSVSKSAQQDNTLHRNGRHVGSTELSFYFKTNQSRLNEIKRPCSLPSGHTTNLRRRHDVVYSSQIRRNVMFIWRRRTTNLRRNCDVLATNLQCLATYPWRTTFFHLKRLVTATYLRRINGTFHSGRLKLFLKGRERRHFHQRANVHS